MLLSPNDRVSALPSGDHISNSPMVDMSNAMDVRSVFSRSSEQSQPSAGGGGFLMFDSPYGQSESHSLLGHHHHDHHHHHRHHDTTSGDAASSATVAYDGATAARSSGDAAPVDNAGSLPGATTDQMVASGLNPQLVAEIQVFKQEIQLLNTELSLILGFEVGAGAGTAPAQAGDTQAATPAPAQSGDTQTATPAPAQGGDTQTATTTNDTSAVPTGRPSWADLTTINNNNGGLVAPAFWAQPVSNDAKYSPANLGNLPLQSTQSFDQGLMIDERGMNPADLQTINTYAASGTWSSNDTTGQKTGTVVIPKGLELPRTATVYSDGLSSNTNSTVTIIEPDGKEMNFAKTYIGPDSALGAGNPVLIGVAMGHTGWFGNEGAITMDEAKAALNKGTAFQHAVDINVPLNVLSNSNNGVAFPAKYADIGHNREYTGTNPLLKMGSHLAVPKDVTAQQLGLETNMGKALLSTMENYGGYIADTTGSNQPDILFDSTMGVTDLVDQSGQFSGFAHDVQKIMRAADVVL